MITSVISTQFPIFTKVGIRVSYSFLESRNIGEVRIIFKKMYIICIIHFILNLLYIYTGQLRMLLLPGVEIVFYEITVRDLREASTHPSVSRRLVAGYCENNIIN